VAGDGELGARVMNAIEDFAYGSPVDADLIEGMRQVRQRMEPRQRRGKKFPLNIKRGPGGLVDVEFIAQVLVLRWGAQDRELRLKGTRPALERLVEKGHLPRREGQILLEAHARLRTVEKGMRIASDKADDALPEGRQLEVLARAVGEGDGAALVREIEALMQENRRIFDRVFSGLANERS
jgi:glutamate-ammonia-ligase adenylyltransferase